MQKLAILGAIIGTALAVFLAIPDNGIARQHWVAIPAAQPNPKPITLDHQISWVWPSGTSRVVLYVHGAGEVGASLFFDALKHPLVTALRAHGYALASLDAGGTAWGTDWSLQAYIDTIRYLRRHGLTQLYILCQSMGGLDALRLVSRVPLVAWAGIYPLTNLASINPTAWPEIRATLGTSFDYYWTRLSPVRAIPPSGLPMIFWSSYGDQEVPRAQNTDETAQAARHDGAQVTVVDTVGGHGDPSDFQPARLLAFYAAAARSTRPEARSQVPARSAGRSVSRNVDSGPTANAQHLRATGGRSASR